MNLHLICLPHTTLTEKDASCAYSMKALKAVPMFQAEGHHVTLYGPDEIDCSPDEHVVITTEGDRKLRGYGGDGYDTTTDFPWDASRPVWKVANTRAINALRERLPAERRGHYLCLATSTQSSVAEAVAGPVWREPITVEWGVGYVGVDARSLHAFESYAWMHHVYGLSGVEDGRAFDAVIPNFFDVSQFSVEPRPKADYLLFMGRIIRRKGPHVALEIAKRVGLPLYIAGPGATEVTEGRIVGADGVVIEGDVQHVGPVGFNERNELMANAVATIVPTLYVEPFGGVAVEAMLAGCPVVASDWGAFTETVTPEVGARFRTPRQGAQGVAEVQSLKREDIRASAVARYSQEAVGPMYTRWFESLDTLWDEGYDIA